MRKIIYKLISPSNGIYIGQTKTSINERFSSHKNDAFNENKPNYKRPLYRAIRKYGWDNFTKEILFDKVAEDIVDDLERYLIYNYRITKHKVYNLDSGGNKQKKRTKETIEKISKGNKGKFLSEEHKEKIRQAKLGKKCSEETKKKMSENKLGIYGENHPSSIKINQYDKDNNFIRSWGSITDAEKELEICGTHISDVCKGKEKIDGRGYKYKPKTAGGFIWKYV